MPIDLEHFGLGEQLRCATVVRSIGAGHATLEAAARAITRSFHHELQSSRVAGTGDPTRACALVRCYKTHPYATLPADLQRFARDMLPIGARPRPAMRCLTLMASAGDEPSWNSRHDSRGHQAIPLASPEMLEKAPMIAQLVRDFGLEPAEVVAPFRAVVRDRKGKNYGVFHVEEALGSPAIPAQDEFVRRHGIRSAVGFGGSLPTGDLFAVILFTRVRVDAAAAERFRAVALNVKSAFFGFAEDATFDAAVSDDRPAPAHGLPTRR
jgi:hypothetical protein